MDPSDMILHVVHAAEESLAVCMRARNAWIVLRFVSIAVFL